MKDSGVEWIGEIPVDWEMKKVKSFLRERSEKNHANEEVLSLYREYGVIPKNSRNDNYNVTSQDTSSYKFVKKDNVVINKMKAWQGSLAVSKYQGIISPAYYIYEIKNTEEIVPEYLHYALRNPLYTQEYKRLSAGLRVGQWDLNKSEFNSLLYPMPSVKVQIKIVSYLNEKIDLIDKAVEDTKQSIEELKKYKQSLITEAVTKGLDKNVEMKDSGIEIIGDINSSYKIIPLGYLGTFQNGISKSSDYFGEGFPFVSYGDIYKNRVLPSQVNGLVKSSEEEQENYSVQKGDIFFTRTSETIEEVGMTSVCLKGIPKATFAGFVIRFRPNNKMILLTEYARYYFDALFIRDFFAKEMNLVTRASLSQPVLKKVPVVIPSIENQKKIINYLDKKVFEIESLIDSKQQVIQELEVYKKSLICEYVTGKKEV